MREIAMGNKNKTISFRVNEDSFETLRDIAEERDISLSAVFRDYVDTLVSHDGQVHVIPERELKELQQSEEDSETFPPKVSVPKSFIREHERLELEAEHLREQLEEQKGYVNYLKEQLEAYDDDEEVILLDDLDTSDSSEGRDSPYHLG